MEFLYLILITPSAISFPQTPCTRIQIGNDFYDREILCANTGRPYNLIVHRATNILFFSYSVTEMYSDVEFQLAYYNIATKEYQNTVGIRGGCSTAIDSVNDDIYLGGNDGIYKFNMATKMVDLYKEKGKNIWSLFHRNNLFYISYPEQRLYMEIDGKFAIVREFEHFEVEHFYITEKGAIYFANKTGLYKYDNDKINIEAIDELITVRQITEDLEDNVYICTNVGIYINEEEGLKKIVDLKNLYGLAFDKDNNFIISDENSIIRLNPSAQGCAEKYIYW